MKVLAWLNALRLRRFVTPSRGLLVRHLRGNGIEIGALNRPQSLPPGTSVRYVDQLSDEDLRRMYPELSRQKTVHVDVVAKAGQLASAIREHTLDFVVASHVVEHVDDPIGFLVDCYRVLRSGGLLYLAIPDKRLTFDQDRARTSLEHLIADFEQPGTPEKAARDRAHYEEWVTHVPKHYPPDQRAYQQDIERLWADRYSIHLHVWEPDDWPAILNFLNEAGAPFRLVDYTNVPSKEDRDEFVLLLAAAERAAEVLGGKLPERGPLHWFVVRLIRRVFFVREAEKILRLVLAPLRGTPRPRE